MSHRANLVIIDHGVPTLYYDHWCASRLDMDLLWGPDEALDFVLQRDPVGLDRLQNEVFGEGGAVLDLDQQRLVWFGGQDTRWWIPRRRALVALMSRTWPDWTLRWADGGVAELADAVGADRAEVLCPFTIAPFGQSDRARYNGGVVTVAGRASMVEVRPQFGALLAGPGGMGLDALETTPLPATREVLHVHAGAHVDTERRTLRVWFAEPIAAARERLAEAWPGWTVHWLGDRYEDHVALVDGLDLVAPPFEEMAAQILEDAAQAIGYAAPNPAAEHAAELKAQGHDAYATAATHETRGASPEGRSAVLDQLRRWIGSIDGE